MGFVLRWMFLSLRIRRRRHFGLAAALALGTLALGLSVVSGLGLGRSLQRHLGELFPAGRIALRPTATSFLWLQVETASITPDTIEKVRALPGVRRASGEATVRFPISASGNLLGEQFETDISVTGIEGWLLGNEEPPNFAYDPADPNAVVPGVLSQYFLDLYNMTLAESNGLPKLSPAAVVGRHLQLLLGQSVLGFSDDSAAKKTWTTPCQIVGLSTNPDLLGLAMPLAAVEEFNRRYGFTDKRYRAVHVELTSPDAWDRLRDPVAKLGLEWRDAQAPWRRGVAIVRLAGFAFIGLGALVFVLSLAYQTSAVNWLLLRRRGETALCRALGASTGQVVFLLLGEIALVSAVGIGAGTAIVFAALRLANGWYHGLRATMTFLPADLFAIPAWWVLLLGGLCWCAALALALRAVRTTLRRSLTDTLSRGASH